MGTTGNGRRAGWWDLVVVTVVLGLTAGCGARAGGSGITTRRAEAGLRGMVRGTSTRQDVLRAFGKPSQSLSNPSGEVLVYRIPAEDEIIAGSQVPRAPTIRILMIFLNRQQRMVDYVFTRPRERVPAAGGT